MSDPAPRAVLNDAEGTWCPCVGDHNPNPAEDEVHHLVPLGWPFGGADVKGNRRRLCGTGHGSVHVLLRLQLAAADAGVPRDRLVHFSAFTRRLAAVAMHALASGINQPTDPDAEWVQATWRTP